MADCGPGPEEIGSFQARQIPLLDINELAAAKLAALLARHTARDLFDAHQLLIRVPLDDAKLRLAFIEYSGMNIEDWRKVSVEHVAFGAEELKRNLIPVLRSDAVKVFEDGRGWAGLKLCRRGVSQQRSRMVCKWCRVVHSSCPKCSEF